MALEVRKATAGDLEPLWGLYAASCARQVPGDMGPDWHMGVYPARSDLEGRLAAGELYVGEQDGALVAGRISRLGHFPSDLDINGVSTYISAIDFVTPERLNIHY